VRTLSSILRRQVVTDTGRSLGRCYDLRGELSANRLRITGLTVGRRGLFEHLGIREQKPPTVVPWSSVVRIEGKRIIVRDSAAAANPKT
jgi:sporulation protein YlmC with PRC-barrel domain